MKQEMNTIVQKYLESHNNLMKAIRRLPYYGNDCSCGDCSIVSVTEYYQEIENVVKYCVNCGGDVKED